MLLVLRHSGEGACVPRDVTHVEQLITGLDFPGGLGQSVIVGVELGLRRIQRVRIGSG